MTEIGLLLQERDLVVAAEQVADHAAVAVLEEGQLGAVAGAADIEAGDEATVGDGDVRDVVREHEVFARAGQDQIVGIEAVALVDEAAPARRQGRLQPVKTYEVFSERLRHRRAGSRLIQSR